MQQNAEIKIDHPTDKPPGRSIRTQLTLLIGAVVLPFALFAGAHLFLSVDELVSEAKADNRVLAELVAHSLSQSMRDNFTLAEGLARRPELNRPGTLECNRLMGDFKQLHVGFIGTGYTDAMGVLRCASTSTDKAPPPTSFADIEWFQRIKSEKKPLVSKPYFGKILKTWLVVVAAPVLDADGNLTGTVNLPFDLRSIRLIRERQMPDHKFITVVDREGTIVTRSSEFDQWMGKNLKGTALVDMALREHHGGGRGKSATGIDTIIGFAEVPEAGWHVIVGARADQVLAPVIRETQNTTIVLLALTLIVLLVTLAIARRISRSLTRLTETTRRVASGNTKERAPLAGPSEVVSLAGDFNRMLDERALAEAALQVSEQRFRDVAGVSADWIWEIDAAGRYTYASESVRPILGYAPEDVIGKTPFDFMSPDEADRVRLAFGTIAIRGDAFHDLENIVLDAQGKPHHTLTSGKPIRNASGQLIGYRGVDRDITDRKKVEQELERLAQTDSLTGLANRRHFMALAEQEISRTVRYGGELSVLMLDIDHFKNVNDTYGHPTGDLVLQKLGSLCRESFRDIDIVGRLGGEEFAVVLPQTGTLQAIDVAERLRQNIATCSLPLPHGQPLHFTVSIGVATLAEKNTNLDTLLGLSDKAMYEAKHGGRNRVCTYGIT